MFEVVAPVLGFLIVLSSTKPIGELAIPCVVAAATGSLNAVPQFALPSELVVQFMPNWQKARAAR